MRTAARALAAALLLACSPSVAADRILSYASHLPASHRLHVQALEPFFRAVERSTRDALRFDLQPGGILTGAAGAPAALRDGAVDGAVLAPGPLADAVPVAGVLGALAHAVRDPRVATAALNETLLRHCPDCLAAFRGKGIRVVGLATGDPVLLHCRTPATDIKEMRGLRIAAEPALHGLLKTLGAAPEDQPALAVRDRLIECCLACIASPVSEAADAVWDVAGQVTALPVAGAPAWYVLAFSQKSWDAIAERHRRAILTAAPVALRGFVQASMTEAATFRALAASRAVVWHPPGSELSARIDSFWAQDSGSEGAGGASQSALRRDVAARFRESVAKWTQIVGVDFDQYEAALRREIYAQLAP